MGYPIYPPSLYRACSYAAGLGVPVYVMVHPPPPQQCGILVPVCTAFPTTLICESKCVNQPLHVPAVT